MNNTPTLIELRALAAIVRHRSFRRAADELDMAPSTLSHMMTGLEQRLAVRLLNRTTRSVMPTPAGDRLVTRVLPILGDLDSVLAEIDAGRGATDRAASCA